MKSKLFLFSLCLTALTVSSISIPDSPPELLAAATPAPRTCFHEYVNCLRNCTHDNECEEGCTIQYLECSDY